MFVQFTFYGWITLLWETIDNAYADYINYKVYVACIFTWI